MRAADHLLPLPSAHGALTVVWEGERVGAKEPKGNRSGLELRPEVFHTWKNASVLSYW